MQEYKKFRKEIKKELSLDYLLYLPDNYEEEKEWPIILFLHGAGEVGSDLELVKTQGLPKYLESVNDFPGIVISPQCPLNCNWSMFLDEVYELLQIIKNQYKVNKKKVYLTGLSMGGYGTWSMALKYPDEFAAIVPICGGLINQRAVVALKDIPIWTFHGAKDNVVPIDASQRLVDILESCNGNIKFTVYPELRHDSWTVTYENTSLYEWLFSHVKK